MRLEGASAIWPPRSFEAFSRRASALLQCDIKVGTVMD